MPLQSSASVADQPGQQTGRAGKFKSPYLHSRVPRDYASAVSAANDNIRLEFVEEGTADG